MNPTPAMTPVEIKSRARVCLAYKPPNEQGSRERRNCFGGQCGLESEWHACLFPAKNFAVSPTMLVHESRFGSTWECTPLLSKSAFWTVSEVPTNHALTKVGPVHGE